MEIVKIVGIGLIGTIIAIVLKQYKAEFAIYVSIVTGIIIISYIFNDLSKIIQLINNLANKSNINLGFIKILLKITGIALLTDFAVSICNDSGEKSIASKVDMGGRIIILSLSVPIISSLLETITQVLP